MCGIAGMILKDGKRTEKELETLRKDFSALMVATQIRGSHATGAFVVNKTGIRYHKAAKPASAMVNSPLWWALMDEICEDTLAVVGHTRFATQGSPTNNDNNHPILAGSLIGVHNGIILNDDEINERCPFEQEVDSAAIFSLLADSAGKQRLSTDTMAEVLPELVGDYAIVVADTRRLDSIFVARDSGRPLVHAYDASKRVLWLSSTSHLLRRVTSAEATEFPANSIARLNSKNGGGARVKTSRFGSTAARPMFSLRLDDADNGAPSSTEERSEFWSWYDSNDDLNTAL